MGCSSQLRKVFAPKRGSPDCAICDTPFMFVKRRHHRRNYGSVCGNNKNTMRVMGSDTLGPVFCVCYDQYLKEMRNVHEKKGDDEMKETVGRGRLMRSRRRRWRTRRNVQF